MSGKTRPPEPGGPGNQAKKRKTNWQRLDISSFPSLEQGDQPIGKFVVVESLNPSKPLKNVNPFVVDKFLKGLFPHGWLMAKGMFNGGILVQVKNVSEADKAVGFEHVIDKTLDLKGKVSQHAGLNQSKGKIYCPSISECDEKEILEKLKDQRVIEVRKITRKVNEGYVPTGILVLTFDIPSIPQKVEIGYLKNVKVEIYYDRPMRCQKCQKLGHSKKKCESEVEVCGKCSEPIPHSEQCSVLKCVNCGGDHASFDRACSLYNDEVKVIEKMVHKKLSYRMAKKEYLEEKAALLEQAKQNQSFAAAAQAAEQERRNPPPVTYEQFSALMTEMQALKQKVSQLEVQIQVRDELLAKHSIALPNDTSRCEEPMSDVQIISPISSPLTTLLTKAPKAQKGKSRIISVAKVHNSKSYRSRSPSPDSQELEAAERQLRVLRARNAQENPESNSQLLAEMLAIVEDSTDLPAAVKDNLPTKSSYLDTNS